MNVAMTALEATIHVESAQGKRNIAIDDFFLLPGTTPERETSLNAGELITHVTLPAPMPGSRSVYLKLRDRASYEFALASAAVVVTVSSGRIDHVRDRAGRRRREAVAFTRGGSGTARAHPDATAFRAAAEAALQSARAAKPERLQGRTGEALHPARTHACHADCLMRRES